jgi:hypothetical protein
MLKQADFWDVLQTYNYKSFNPFPQASTQKKKKKKRDKNLKENDDPQFPYSV